jgi:hypothetical protein
MNFKQIKYKKEIKNMNENLTKILYNLKVVEEHEEVLEKEKKELKDFINNTINVNDFNNMTYLDAKKIYNKLWYKLSKENVQDMQEMLENKKFLEYPLINDVHYYPIVNEIPNINLEQRLHIDKSLKKAYFKKENAELYIKDKQIINFLLEKHIIEKVYIFRCNCSENDDCTPEYITQDQYDDFMSYHNLINDKNMTEDEKDVYWDENFQDGHFEVGCWNGEGYEVCDIDDFNKHLNCIRYKVIIKPDISLDDL